MLYLISLQGQTGAPDRSCTCIKTLRRRVPSLFEPREHICNSLSDLHRVIFHVKEKILQLKHEHPDWGYKRIGKAISCSPNLVKYHLHPQIKEQYLHRQSQNRAVRMTKLKLQHGGRCQICKYNRCFDSLCFHHLDPKTKLGSVPDIMNNLGIGAAREEAKKCILLCANCHGELHAGLHPNLEACVGVAPT